MQKSEEAFNVFYHEKIILANVPVNKKEIGISHQKHIQYAIM